MIGMLGGRAAEELDLRRDDHRPRVRPRAGHLARPPDGRPLGHVRGGRRGLGAAPARARRATCRQASTSQHTLELIDEEVKRIISECADEANRPLTEHRDQLDHLAQALLERETLEEAEAYAAAGIPQPELTGPLTASQT